MAQASYVDIHTHGQFQNEDLDVILVKSLSEKEFNSDLSGSVLYSAGIHPWWTLDYTRDEISEFQSMIEKLCMEKKLFAIGETGLDRVYKETIDQQKELFQWHINLSEKFNLPLIIHSVKSGSDVLEYLKSQRPKMPWIFHDFRGNRELIDQVLKLHNNVFFSFGISLDNSQVIRELVRDLKIEHILLETDAQRHLNIHDVYLRATKQLGIDLDLLKSLMLSNFKKICTT